MGKQYELYVQKGQPVWKIFTNILFSHVGMFILVIGYCVGGQILELEIQWDYTQVFDAGAYVFMYLEEEREELARLDKEAATMVMFLIKKRPGWKIFAVCSWTNQVCLLAVKFDRYKG